MSTDSVKTLALLQKSLVQFFDELVETFPRQGDFVIFRIMIKDRIPTTDIVSHFKKTLVPHLKIIKEKTSGKEVSVSLLQIMNTIFSGLGSVSSSTFEDLLNTLHPVNDKETIDAMWRWLDVFGTLTEKC